VLTIDLTASLNSLHGINVPAPLADNGALDDGLSRGARRDLLLGDKVEASR